jgi:hypothetical protein
MRVAVISIIIIVSSLSCNKADEFDVHKEYLIGNWINPVYSDSLITFERSGWSNIDAYHISILGNGKVIERKNAGWCGTPPITMADFEGTWRLGDSILIINVGCWGGDAEYQWKVVSADLIRLKVVIVKQTFTFPYSY